MLSVMFVLPVGGGGGGAHSVMQEADAMWRFGVATSIASNEENATKLRRGYKDLRTIHNHIFSYSGALGLSTLIHEQGPSVVVATTNQSVHVLAEALKLKPPPPGVRIAYYVQDYEPLFYERNTDEWLIAHSSYVAIPDMLLFAKTRWLQEVVEANHGVQVQKVEPSIDHEIYYPSISDRLGLRDKIRVGAMIRPSTARRAPRRTVRILNRLAHDLSDKISCCSFGCSDEELRYNSLRLDGVEHFGILRREEVGDLFRDLDLFLDLSDFQAFGRTAIEAMSCGVTAVVPAHGGAYEFAVHGRNAFIVDTRNDIAIIGVVVDFLSMTLLERSAMTMKAIASGYDYNADRAALSEIRLFMEL